MLANEISEEFRLVGLVILHLITSMKKNGSSKSSFSEELRYLMFPHRYSSYLNFVDARRYFGGGDRYVPALYQEET